MKEMGTSSPSRFFQVSIVAYEVSVANIYKMNSLRKLGLINEGALAMASLMLAKASRYAASHLYYAFCFTIFCRGLTISAKLGMNLWTKFIFPMNDCMDFLL